MNKYLYRLLTLGLALVLATSCDDTLSTIGEGIQTRSDVVDSEKYFIQFEGSTVASPKLYTGDSPIALLGAYSDASYGSFHADFATQFRTAIGGLSFDTIPKAGIDSVTLLLRLPAEQEGAIGSKTATQQISVYELPTDFSGAEESQSDLSQYADASKLLGQQTISLKQDRKTVSYMQGTQEIVQYYSVALRLDKALGERIYRASMEQKEKFATQEIFNRQVFSGIYVTSSAGRGFVMRISAVLLRLHYTYTGGDGKDKTAYKDFINTKLSSRRSGLSSTDISGLLASDSKYSYSKGPAGVQVNIKLAKSEMERLLQKQGNIKIGSNWTLADSQLDLAVDNPSNLLLNPPSYMLLMPVDSIANFFRNGETERSAPATSYLSTEYNSTNKHYNFYNISRLITKHLQTHASYQAGVWTVSEDLNLRLLPVERSITTGRDGSAVTTAIDEYLFPSFVRLKTSSEDLRIGVVATIFR